MSGPAKAQTSAAAAPVVHNTPVVTLAVAGGMEYVVDQKHACVSRFVKKKLAEDAKCKRVDLSPVKAKTLNAIVGFMQHHEGKEPAVPQAPLRSVLMKDIWSAWDAAFIDTVGEDKETLYDLAHACAPSRVDIPPLFELAASKIASFVKGQPPEKYRQLLAVASVPPSSAPAPAPAASPTAAAKK